MGSFELLDICKDTKIISVKVDADIVYELQQSKNFASWCCLKQLFAICFLCYLLWKLKMKPFWEECGL